MIAAVLPIPPRPEFPELTEQDARKSRLDMLEEMNRIWSPMDEKRYQNARWWRILNRIFSVVGVAIITLIVRIPCASSFLLANRDAGRSSCNEDLTCEYCPRGYNFPGHHYRILAIYYHIFHIYNLVFCQLPIGTFIITNHQVAHYHLVFNTTTTRFRPHMYFLFMIPC